jgi:hypothetical protein
MDAEELEFLERYVLLCFAPVLEDKLFRYDRSYTEGLADMVMQGKLLFARKVVSKGVREAKRPGLVFLNRIQYGLASILSSMEAEANWFRLTREMDDELQELASREREQA